MTAYSKNVKIVAMAHYYKPVRMYLTSKFGRICTQNTESALIFVWADGNESKKF